MRGMERNANRVGGGMVGAEMETEVGWGVYAKNERRREIVRERERERQFSLD